MKLYALYVYIEDGHHVLDQLFESEQDAQDKAGEPNDEWEPRFVRAIYTTPPLKRDEGGEWHIQDVGTVSVHEITGGVRLQHVGYDLGMRPDEARELARALVAAAELAELKAANPMGEGGR